MPLIKKPGRKAFEQNLKTEIATGKPLAQDLAIAYRVGGETNRGMAAAIKKRGRRR
jgi:hypothetical protein